MSEYIIIVCRGAVAGGLCFEANATKEQRRRRETGQRDRESDKTIPFPVDRLYNGYETKKKTSHRPKSDAENPRQMSGGFEPRYTATQTDCHCGECSKYDIRYVIILYICTYE